MSQKYTLNEVNGSGISGTVLFESAGDEADDSKIDHVSLGNIDNNTSGANCETYSDFTDQIANLGAGETATVTVTLGTCEDNYPKYGKVYIDWDLDGDFTEAEVVASTASPIDSTGSFSGTFSIPGDARIGTSMKMRVVCWESEYTADDTTSFELSNVTACSDALYLWGETEDYTINIVEPSLPDLVPQILSIDATTAGAGAAVNAVVRVLNQSAV